MERTHARPTIVGLRELIKQLAKQPNMVGVDMTYTPILDDRIRLGGEKALVNTKNDAKTERVTEEPEKQGKKGETVNTTVKVDTVEDTQIQISRQLSAERRSKATAVVTVARSVRQKCQRLLQGRRCVPAGRW